MGTSPQYGEKDYDGGLSKEIITNNPQSKQIHSLDFLFDFNNFVHDPKLCRRVHMK